MATFDSTISVQEYYVREPNGSVTRVQVSGGRVIDVCRDFPVSMLDIHNAQIELAERSAPLPWIGVSTCE